MSFWQFLQNNWIELVTLIREHLVLVFISIVVAVLIGVPTGVLLTRYRSWRGPVLGIANVMQTIPSLALFGFLIPLPFIGGIGTRTALVALVLYSLLPIIRNTVTGILGVEPSVREAAVAMGMTDSQVLRQVELPLAAGVIVTGVRVATVIAVGVTQHNGRLVGTDDLPRILRDLIGVEAVRRVPLLTAVVNDHLI